MLSGLGIITTCSDSLYVDEPTNYISKGHIQSHYPAASANCNIRQDSGNPESVLLLTIQATPIVVWL